MCSATWSLACVAARAVMQPGVMLIFGAGMAFEIDEASSSASCAVSDESTWKGSAMLQQRVTTDVMAQGGLASGGGVSGQVAQELKFGLQSSRHPESNFRVWFFSHRSCSQHLESGCNQGFKQEMEAARAQAAKAGIDQDHTVTFFGLPEALMNDPAWSQHISPGMRGRGYWFWKPALANLLLNNRSVGIKDDDVVIYVDGDQTGGIPEHFNIVQKRYAEGFDMVVHRQRWKGCCCEHVWTKGDIFKRFGVRPDCMHYGRTQQYWAGMFIFRVNDKTRKFMRMWEEAMKDYHLVSDEASKEPNSKDFRENRHDQSMYSMLLKASRAHNGDCNGAATISSEADEDHVSLVGSNHTEGWKVHPRFGIPDLHIVQVE